MSHPWLAVAHAAGIVVAVWGCLDRRPFARTVGDLLPLFVAPMLYGEVPLLIGALGSSYHDVRVQRWELAIFGQHPSRVLAGLRGVSAPNPRLVGASCPVPRSAAWGRRTTSERQKGAIKSPTVRAKGRRSIHPHTATTMPAACATQAMGAT